MNEPEIEGGDGPVVGTIVKFQEYGAPNTNIRAALITNIHNKDVVDLAVFKPNGIEFVLNVLQGDREGQ